MKNLTKPKNKIIKKLITLFLLAFTSCLAFFIIWAKSSYKPTSLAMDSLKDTENITVTNTDENFIVFTPNNCVVTKGFIFYPGAKVEPESYAMLCKEICEEGFLVVIAPMTLELAILSPNRAEGIINKFNYINTWAIGGHSLGGVMAGNYATKDDNIKGLVLYASYPQGDALKDYDKKVISIYGSLDGVADLEKVKNAILPNDSEIIEIPGGNHAQFGNYGKQTKDNDATISEDEQIKQAAKYTVELLNSL